MYKGIPTEQLTYTYKLYFGGQEIGEQTQQTLL